MIVWSSASVYAGLPVIVMAPAGLAPASGGPAAPGVNVSKGIVYSVLAPPAGVSVSKASVYSVIDSRIPSPNQRGNIDFDQIRWVARQGPGSQFQMFGGGTPVAGHAAVYDANGNVVDGGGASGLFAIRLTSVNTTMTNADYTVVATAPSITITLPPTPATGQIHNAKNGNTTVGMLITVSSGSTALIDQASSLSLGATSSVMVQWDGTQWRIL